MPNSVHPFCGKGHLPVVANTRAPGTSTTMTVGSMRFNSHVLRVQANLQPGQTMTFRLRSGRTMTVSQSDTVFNPMLRRSGPDRPASACVVVALDIASCSTDEQLPATAPAQLLERGVCTQSDWERWSTSFAARQARCQCLPGCAAWMFALLILPVVYVARRDKAYYKGVGEWVAGLNSELAPKDASVFYRYDPGPQLTNNPYLPCGKGPQGPKGLKDLSYRAQHIPGSDEVAKSVTLWFALTSAEALILRTDLRIDAAPCAKCEEGACEACAPSGCGSWGIQVIGVE
ncbi:hypothetical protein T484DRAFT_1745102 [Baffinella frigidus]|nr:hypothetical protein T484DRAFT_1745102 [Cryptophyta sp. CCMP2293]